MKQVYPFKYFSLVLFLLLPYITIGQYTAEKVTNEELSMEKGAEFKVENKYGDITIVGWDQPMATIKSIIKVKKKDQDDAEELLERINVDVSNFGRYVNLKTEIEERNTGFLSRLITELLDGDLDLEFDKSDLEIDFEIQLPNDTDLEITNSFGDVIISEWKGVLSADMRHGDLHVTDSFKKASIKHSFGKINFLEVENATLNLRNANLKADRINDLRLDSHGSEIVIKQIDFFNIDSNKDEIRIESAKRIKGNARFGTVLFNEIMEEIYLDLWVTDLRVSQLNSSAPYVYLKQQNSEIDINISNTNFSIEAEMEGGIFRIPETLKDLKSKTIDEKKNLRTISGFYGVSSEGRFNLEGKRGFVILREL